ncbi:DUF1799 domain-containing protein [Chromobacterium subtsugae]|uniref:DUF1799 domain-containing protein n=1 Tax=Chromobacterium subtsugae TaxID=251747 RepID=UPI000AFC56E4|nr:DUF1799 domain-containing protein [Chromobacterium subtsugae]
MRWQFGERAASRSEDRQALLAAGVPLEQADAMLPARCDVEAFALLPDALPAWRLWQAMQTQWRVGPVGPYGLDYAALPVVERRVGLPAAQRAEVFDCLQDMEQEALRLMAKKGA